MLGAWPCAPREPRSLCSPVVPREAGSVAAVSSWGESGAEPSDPPLAPHSPPATAGLVHSPAKRGGGRGPASRGSGGLGQAGLIGGQRCRARSGQRQPCYSVLLSFTPSAGCLQLVIGSRGCAGRGCPAPFRPTASPHAAAAAATLLPRLRLALDPAQ